MDKLNTTTLAKYTDDELKKIKQFAMMPTGALGVHDFILGRRIEGVLHIVLTFIVFLFCNGLGEMVCESVGNCNNSGEIETFYRSILMLGALFATGSYVWALFEGDKITGIISERNKTPQQKIQEAKELEEYKAKKPERKRETQKAFSIASVITGAIIFAIFLLFLSIEARLKYTPNGYYKYGMTSAMFEGGTSLSNRTISVYPNSSIWGARYW